jgi:hypothetical protein
VRARGAADAFAEGGAMKKMLLVVAGLLGCGPNVEHRAASSNAAAGASTSAAASPAAARGWARDRARMELPQIGPEEVRVPLVVVPGDAPVEVDGLRVRRRNGAVELTGKPGDVHRVRTYVGATPGEEKPVTIMATGTSPSRIDANEAKPAAPVKARSKPARFNMNE